MGLCNSTGGGAHGGASTDIDRQLKEENLAESRIPKVLLLGTGESGKSTVFKQSIKLYGEGLGGDQMAYKQAITRNVLDSIHELASQSKRLAEEGENTKVDAANEEALQYMIDHASEESALSDKLTEYAAALWKDPGIQATFDLRSKFQLVDSAEYFLNKVEDLAKADYVVTDDDILRVRVRTTGMTEQLFKMSDNFQLRMVDVGGQRSERKKWIRWFDGVTAVIFVTAISEYDCVLFEDENTNRMEESLRVFEDTVNLHTFASSSFILFLNKRDLFEEKLKTVSLANFFPEYTGTKEEEPESAFAFVEQQFLARADPQKQGDIYVHVTCATDTSTMSKVFDSVKHSLLKTALKDVNLI